MLRRDPKDIAAFLRRGGVLLDGRSCGEHLDRRAVGEFLGWLGGKDAEGRDFQKAVLQAFCSGFSFTRQPIIASLRSFLAEFRLPGEAQMIDRIMCAFSETYVRDNPGTFFSADPAYVLAYAAIMLNTDLHKSGIKKKMTRAEFVGNMRRLDTRGTDYPTALLDEAYAEILRAPLALDHEPDFLTFASPSRQGWLLKRCTGAMPRWRRRLFVLTDGVLYYFGSEAEVASGRPRCILPLDNTQLQVVGSLGLRILPRQATSHQHHQHHPSSSTQHPSSRGGPGRHPSTPSKPPPPTAPLASPPSSPFVPAVTLTACSPSPSRPLHPHSSSEHSGEEAGGAGQLRPLLKCAKRNPDGSVKRARQTDFEVQAATPTERDEWAAALTAHMADKDRRGGADFHASAAGGAMVGGGAAAPEPSAAAGVGFVPSAAPASAAASAAASVAAATAAAAAAAASSSSSSSSAAAAAASAAASGTGPGSAASAAGSSASTNSSTISISGGTGRRDSSTTAGKRSAAQKSPHLTAMVAAGLTAIAHEMLPRGHTSRENLLAAESAGEKTRLSTSISDDQESGERGSGGGAAGSSGGLLVGVLNSSTASSREFVEDSDLSSVDGDEDITAFEVAEEVSIMRSAASRWTTATSSLSQGVAAAWGGGGGCRCWGCSGSCCDSRL